MAIVWIVLVSAGVALVIGSLPLGALWIRRVGGIDPRDVNPHLLGVENVFQMLGPPVAIGAFLLDVVKGAVAVAALPAPGVAAFAVLAGHLLPIRLPGDRWPRGRGNGVLLGATASLVAAGVVPWGAAVVGAAVFAASLARWGYATPSTLLGLIGMLLWPGTPWLLLVAWTALLTARGWLALARIADGTEPRLGDPPPVRGLEPGRVRAAFMIHPLSIDDLWQVRSQAWAHHLHRRGWLPEAWLRKLLPWLRPQVHDILRGVILPDGRTLEVVLIGGPMLPDQIRAEPEVATRMAIRGARLARELGAEAFGLGAFWSTVGEKGRRVQEAVPDLPVTHGGTYTAATVRAAIPGLLERYAAEGGTLAQATAAVVGANGVVAFGVARDVAPHVGSMILIGRDLDRLERSAATLRRKNPNVHVACSTEVDDVGKADLVFTATSDPDPVVLPHHVKPGAWIYDLGRPADVEPSVREVPGVQLVPGGVVRPPGRSVSELDLHFGDGLVPACLAETMILAATGAHERALTGGTARIAEMSWFLEQGEALGFEIVTRDVRSGVPDEERTPA
ncbi:MAG: glycerol-3-phosphate acyltransferase [Trueperaceae bacterium]